LMITRLGQGRREPVRRTLEAARRLLDKRMTLDFRVRKLRDEMRSGGIQPAYIRVINRRLTLLMPCLKRVINPKEIMKK